MEIKGIIIVNKISSQQVKKQFYAENVTMIKVTGDPRILKLKKKKNLIFL